MRQQHFLLSLALLGAAPQALCQEPQAVPASFTARIVGDLPDGSPPPAPKEKRRYVVPPEDVLESRTISQDGRQVTMRRISPIPLPEPPPPPALREAASQDDAGAVAFAESSEFLFVGATIHRPADSPPRSLVTLHPQGGGEGVTFWSSADFALLSGFASFTGRDGVIRSLVMTWGDAANDPPSGGDDTEMPEQNVPPIPHFPKGPVTFQVIGGAAPREALTAVRALHDLYNAEHDRLLAAFQGRERARLAQEAELKANPTRPKDIVIHYWRVETPAPQKGGDR